MRCTIIRTLSKSAENVSSNRSSCDVLLLKLSIDDDESDDVQSLGSEKKAAAHHQSAIQLLSPLPCRLSHSHRRLWTSIGRCLRAIHAVVTILSEKIRLDSSQHQKNHHPSSIEREQSDNGCCCCCWSTCFDRVMRSEAGRQLFSRFLESEFSEENMLFWCVCRDYERELSGAKRRVLGETIFQLFLKPGAPMEVNVEQAIMLDVEKKLNDSTTTTPDEHLFQKAQNAVYLLMKRDPFQRFVHSDVYQSFAAAESTHAAPAPEDEDLR